MGKMNDQVRNSGHDSEESKERPKKHVAIMGIKGLPHNGGAESVVEGIVKRINYSQYDISVYCDRRLIPSTASVPNVNLIRVPTMPGKHLRSLTLFLGSLFDALFHRNFDLIHLHNVEASFLLPFLRLKYKVITTSHGQAQAVDKWGWAARSLIALMEYPFVKLSTNTTSVSRSLAAYYESKYGSHTYYIPNGVETPPASSNQAVDSILAEANLDRDYILFAAGRIIPIKGCHLILEAHKNLPKEKPPLVIVGDLGQVPSYEQRLKDLTGEEVRYIPFVSDKNVLFNYVRGCRFFVFPSLQEAMSIMLLEVASLRVPIICSDIPANVDILEGHALFFASGDATDLQKKIEWALQNEDKMAAMALATQEHVRSSFNWEHIAKQYQELYG